MISILQIDILKKSLAALSFGLLLAATLLTLPAQATDANATDTSVSRLSVLTSALPADFHAKSMQAGLTVDEIERLEALQSNIVYILLAENQPPEAAFQILNAAFPQAGFEMLDDMDEGFDLIEY